jgi:hypothetical protein
VGDEPCALDGCAYAEVEALVLQVLKERPARYASARLLAAVSKLALRDNLPPAQFDQVLLGVLNAYAVLYARRRIDAGKTVS